MKNKEEYFKLEITANKNFFKYIKSFKSFKNALIHLNKLKEENDNNVVLPVKVTKSKNRGYIDANYEYIIIQRVDNEDDDGVTMLRNDYGELVKHQTIDVKMHYNRKKWKILHKEKHYIEEIFQIFGYDKNNVTWIYNNFLKNRLTNKYQFCKIIIFNNKLIIDYDEDDFELIITKNKSECIRLYNKLQELSQKDKLKNILYSGFILKHKRSFWVENIMKKTGWDSNRVNRNSLRP